MKGSYNAFLTTTYIYIYIIYIRIHSYICIDASLLHRLFSHVRTAFYDETENVSNKMAYNSNRITLNVSTKSTRYVIKVER